jgi:alkane 1-monooxygenase
MNNADSSGGWRICGYFLGLVSGLVLVATNLTGGNWTLAPLAVLAAMQVADLLSRDDRRDPSPTSGWLADTVMLAHVAVHTAAVLSLLYGVHSGILNRSYVWYAAIGTGLNSGWSGIVAAHELIHRGSRTLRALGAWNLLLVNYGHFRVEHMVHHRLVGTPLDPATARRGESVYWFFLRTVPQQFRQALTVEAERVRRRGGFPWGPANFVVLATAAEIGICIWLHEALGPRVLQAHLVQSFFAIVQLEIINYVEHYGLVRGPGEPLEAHHSWGTDVVASRYSLLELVRHSDHHLHAARPYTALVSHVDSPRLPGGYWSMTWLSLLPPLWFRLVDPRIPERREAQSRQAA